jgi:S-adenosylmethionine:tRNA ribosyltransferase-isomerase
MKTSDFDYHLPPEQIAQHPLAERDASRLLVMHRADGRLEHRRFRDISDYLRPGDILVANNSRVIPARLYGRKVGSGGRVELLLLEELTAERAAEREAKSEERAEERRWRVLAGGRRLVEGVAIELDDKAGRPAGIRATITAVLDGAQREVTFDRPLGPILDALGHTPLPPYIREPLADAGRYQTIYARPPGSAAAPTAGLHFSPELLLSLREKGVLFETCTLHVGLDTFQPVNEAQVEEHIIHSEWATLSPEAARRINEAKLAGGRLVAVGTTSVRVLETAALRSAGVMGSLQRMSEEDSLACPWRPVAAFEGPTDLYIYPGYRFRAVDALITNFHLPQSTLLMLVSAFAGRERILAAYETAVREGYRFYSFGDAMLIL